MTLYEKLEEAESWGKRLKIIDEFFSNEKSLFKKETKLLSIRDHLDFLYAIGDKCSRDEPYESKDYPIYILAIQNNKKLLVVDSEEKIYCLRTNQILQEVSNVS